MKKILALVLALMMALMCTGALAEATRIDLTETEKPAVHAELGEGLYTVTASLALDGDMIPALANMMGVLGEEQLPVLNNVLNLVNNASVKLGVFEKGVQNDIQLKGTPVISFAGAPTEDGGFVIASDLIPNYLLTASAETIQKVLSQVQEMMNQYTNTYAGLADGIDPEALMNAVLPHVTAFVSALQEKIGEPEMGEYTFEGAPFQAKIPVNMTVKEAAGMISDLIHGVLGEEAFVGLIDAVASAANTPVDVNGILESLDSVIANITEMPDEEQPALEIALYQGMDEEGGTNIYLTIALSKDEQAISICGGKVGRKAYAHLNVFDELTLDASAGQDEEIVAAELKINFQGMFVGIEAKAAGLQNVTVALYFMNPQAPIAVLTVETVPGAESTLALDSEGKTVVTLEDLMNDDTGAASAGLVGDLANYGLNGLLAKAAQLMPDEVTALMGLLSGVQ